MQRKLSIEEIKRRIPSALAVEEMLLDVFRVSTTLSVLEENNILTVQIEISGPRGAVNKVNEMFKTIQSRVRITVLYETEEFPKVEV